MQAIKHDCRNKIDCRGDESLRRRFLDLRIKFADVPLTVERWASYGAKFCYCKDNPYKAGLCMMTREEIHTPALPLEGIFPTNKVCWGGGERAPCSVSVELDKMRPRLFKPANAPAQPPLEGSRPVLILPQLLSDPTSSNTEL